MPASGFDPIDFNFEKPWYLALTFSVISEYR
jgi:hypothetical protein